MKTHVHTKTCTRMFIAAYLEAPQTGNNSMDEWTNLVYLYNGLLSKGTTGILNNMDESQNIMLS